MKQENRFMSPTKACTHSSTKKSETEIFNIYFLLFHEYSYVCMYGAIKVNNKLKKTDYEVERIRTHVMRHTFFFLLLSLNKKLNEFSLSSRLYVVEEKETRKYT